MASMTLYVSIWVSFIVVGALIFPSTWNDRIGLFNNMVQNPINFVTALLQEGFTGDSAGLILSLLTSVTAAVIVSVFAFGGGGFSILFAIPLMIIFVVMQIFALPTASVMNADLPTQILLIYHSFIGMLTILTALSFTAGRN